MSSPKDFEFTRELGCGSWSTVMETKHLASGRRFAVKILSKAQLIKLKKVKYATVEKDALAKLSATHPGIIKMWAAFQDEASLSPRASTFVGSAAYVAPELLNRASKTTSNSSDIWAIGCTLYFMIAGKPAFSAINDYQSFRKIEALDYSFSDDFYESAKELIKCLVVLDPSERLGVEPKSSSKELREHPFFTNQLSQESDTQDSAIRWDSLWTDPSIPPETGIIPPSNAAADESNEELWDNVVHEFSLASIGSVNIPSLQRYTGEPSSDPPVPVDVPLATPSPVVETVPVGNRDSQESEGQEPDGVIDEAAKKRDWSSILESQEVIRHATSARATFRWGLLKQPRPCTLLLTSQPRLICVVANEKNMKPTLPDVKKAFVFGHYPHATARAEKQPIVLSCKIDGPQHKLLLTTAEKEYAYDLPDSETLQRWQGIVTTLLESP
ncbi:kinase-like domain-containing protein [Epithele typhae]|uniref:kinase-like domain-containing protein n=1 Tax=Epithele typhae TaxID=378194 RepID=UPI0020083E21|nr:kinase-like domain-containing protein [Epithele typhae]KAH9941589.1 kinase-like domain-containing protein [Epithele typhae]